MQEHETACNEIGADARVARKSALKSLRMRMSMIHPLHGCDNPTTAEGEHGKDASTGDCEPVQMLVINSSSAEDTNNEYIYNDQSDHDLSFLQTQHASTSADLDFSKATNARTGGEGSNSSSNIANNPHRHRPDLLASEKVHKAAPVTCEGQYASSFTRSAILHAQTCGFREGQRVPEWASMKANAPPRGTNSHVQLIPTSTASPRPTHTDPKRYAEGVERVVPELEALLGCISPFVPNRKRKP